MSTGSFGAATLISLLVGALLSMWLLARKNGDDR